MKLTGADNSGQLSVVVDCVPYLMIYSICVHQFIPQVRAMFVVSMPAVFIFIICISLLIVWAVC